MDLVAYNEHCKLQNHIKKGSILAFWKAKSLIKPVNFNERTVSNLMGIKNRAETRCCFVALLSSFLSSFIYAKELLLHLQVFCQIGAPRPINCLAQ